MARPEKEIDEILLEKLASNLCSDKLIADCLGVHVDTLHRRYSDKIDEIRAKTKAKLSNVIIDDAINNRKEYAIKMTAQRYLGYADKVESINLNNNIEYTNLKDNDLDTKIKTLIDKGLTDDEN